MEVPKIPGASACFDRGFAEGEGGGGCLRLGSAGPPGAPGALWLELSVGLVPWAGAVAEARSGAGAVARAGAGVLGRRGGTLPGTRAGLRPPPAAPPWKSSPCSRGSVLSGVPWEPRLEWGRPLGPRGGTLPGTGKARQGKARQGKARQGKARQGKARQGNFICIAHFHKQFVSKGLTWYHDNILCP